MDKIIVLDTTKTTLVARNISSRQQHHRVGGGGNLTGLCPSPSQPLVRRLALLTLAILSLAAILQTTDSREWAPSRRSVSASRRPNAHLRLIRSDAGESESEVAASVESMASGDEADGTTEAPMVVVETATEAPSSLSTEPPAPSQSEAKGDGDGDDDKATVAKHAPEKPKDKSRSSSSPEPFDMDAFERLFKTKNAHKAPNPDSGVQKGSETELPKEPVQSVGSSDLVSDENGENTGVVVHNDSPATKAEKGTAVDEPVKQPDNDGQSSGSKSDHHQRASNVAAADESPAKTTTEPPKANDDDDDDDDDDSEDDDSKEAAKDSRAAGSDISPKPSKSPSKVANKKKKKKSNTTKPPVDNKSIVSKPSSTTTLKPANGNAAAAAKTSNVTEKILDTAKTVKTNLEKVKEGIAELGAKSEKLAKRKNTTIVLNGRKFDQVESIECVDPLFYKMLMDDLKLIEPAMQRDYYGTYYDYEYAKAIAAIVDTPQVKGSKLGASVVGEKRPVSTKSDIAGDIVDEVRRFWKETHDTYVSHKIKLGPEFGPRGMGALTRLKRAAKQHGRHDKPTPKATKTVAVAPAITMPRHKAALANYRYLLARLEQLKLMLMNGEEALIVLNNRVKKLNQVPTEAELHGALCSCITSRGGRAALSAMNELFVDKDSAKLMSNPEQGRRRGEDAARDVAEFCAFWYGDTMRSEAVQKEKQIKKLVMRVARRKELMLKNKDKDKRKRKLTTQRKTTKVTETTLTTNGNMTKREVHTRVVTQIVQMTELWMPELSKWIKTTLDVKSTNVTDGKPVIEEIPGNSTSISRQKRNVTTTETSDITHPGMDSLFSPLFDSPINYADIEDVESGPETEFHDPGHATMMVGDYESPPMYLRRRRRAATTASPASVKKTHHHHHHHYHNHKHPNASRGLLSPNRNKDKSHNYPKVTPTPEPATTEPPFVAPVNETDFESRISNRTSACARHGFAELISVGFDQNSLMYETNYIKKDDKYIIAFRDAFINSFPTYWKQKRDHWSQSMATDGGTNKTGPPRTNNNTDTMVARKSRSVDEEIDDSMGDGGGAYERGARLGFTVGKFIGDKAANQWPDPAELNTFTYDSLFLAGVGHGYSEEDSRILERKIVSETAKRVAFSEASRQVFAKTLHSSYLNGAFIVPIWGVLHGQRAVSKQAAKEGGKTGFDAASRAIKEFIPKATKFFLNHQHERALAAPYKPLKHNHQQKQQQQQDGGNGDTLDGLKEQIEQVKLESELNRNISESAIDCGQKSGSVMGALMGLIVAPEAFETYTRIRGSLEALENEFNQFKLGAMRGYELGETWAHLNYTVSMNRNLQAMKSQMGSHPDGWSPPKTTTAPSKGKSSKGNSTTTTVAPSKAEVNRKWADKADKISSSSLFGSKLDLDGSNDTNTNNIFQFMVLNYGTHLVVNHSRQHMLKFRSVSMDENLLRDMKIQSGDLIADSANLQLSSSDSDDGDELFESGHYNGELEGEFNSIDNKRKTPLKFNIIDLGPVLEMNDEVEAPTRGSSHNSSLETTPLTNSLAKVGKIFMKFSVARRKRSNDDGHREDDVARFLNGGPDGQWDEGDGYLCGTFSQLTSHLANGTSVQIGDPSGIQEDDDFSTEVAILDELFERIEGAPLKMGTVSLVEGVMSMTTSAPKRIEMIDYKSPANNKTSTPSPQVATTKAPRMDIPQTTTTTTSEPSSPQPEATTEAPTESSPATEAPEVTTTTPEPTTSTTTTSEPDVTEAPYVMKDDGTAR